MRLQKELLIVKLQVLLFHFRDLFESMDPLLLQKLQVGLSYLVGNDEQQVESDQEHHQANYDVSYRFVGLVENIMHTIELEIAFAGSALNKYEQVETYYEQYAFIDYKHNIMREIVKLYLL